MEVHAHAHTARQKWTHYLWEFIMLFLAVFCGFLAENLRESQVEHHREKEYMESMVEDLKTDTAKLSKLILYNGQVIAGLDNLLSHYDDIAAGRFSPAYEQYAASLNGYKDFIYTDRTITQLKNSGGMRLIRQQNVSDSIMDYDAGARDYLLEQTGLQRHYENVSEKANQLFNFRFIRAAFQKIMAGQNPDPAQADVLLTHEKQPVEEFYNTIVGYRSSLLSRQYEAGELKKRAERLIGVIEGAYGK